MNNTMRGVWLSQGKITMRHDLPIPQITKGDALIKTRMAGICGTDLQLLKGYYDFAGTPGHEFVGEVIQADDAPDLVGQRVTGDINIACNHCQYCENQQAHHCENRKVLGIKNHHGAFAEYFTLPVKNLCVVDKDIEDRQAVFAEPLAAALHIKDQLHLKDKTVLIIGAGKLGLLIALALQHHCSRLHVMYRHAAQGQQLDTLRIESLDEQHALSHNWDIVIEASGSPEAMEKALQCVRPQGSIVIKSTYHEKSTLDLSQIVVNEISIIGSRCGNIEDALTFIRDNNPPLEYLVTQTFPIENACEAFQQAAQAGMGKVLLDFTI